MPLGMLQYALYKSPIDTEALSLILHIINRHFIHQLFNIENYLISHNSHSSQNFQKTKTKPVEYILHLCANLCSKFKIYITIDLY